MSLKILKNSDGNQHACNVSTVVCFSDGVISGSDDGKIKLSDISNSFRPFGFLLVHYKLRHFIRLLQSSRVRFRHKQISARVWKHDLQQLGEMEAPSGILSMAVCDHMLYTCSTDDTIQSWDLATLKNAGRLATTLSNTQKLFFDKMSRSLWAGDSQGNVAKFENGEECGKYELVEEIWDLMVFGKPGLVYTARDRDVVVSEIITGERTRVMVKATHQGRSPMCIAGNHLCFLDRDGRNIQVHENSVEKKFPHVKEIVASELIINAVAAGGNDVVYTGGYDSTVKKWSLKTGTCIGSVSLGAIVNSLACRNENDAYVARSDGLVTKIGA